MPRSHFCKSVVELPSVQHELLTVRETASILRLSESAIRSWILQKHLPYIKLLNGVVRIRRTDIDALLAASAVPAAKDKSERAA